MTSEPPNPERRSNNAMLCFCIGLGLLALSWFLGVGSVFAVAFAGGLGGPAVGLAALASSLALMLAACSGAVLMFIGIIWIIVRVIADQRGTPDRYRDIQR